LPTPWYFPFQFVVGIHTSKLIAGDMTPTTRQMGRAIVPTGEGFEPAGSDWTSVIVVSGKFSAVKVARVQGAVAATGGGASTTVAIRAIERTRRKKRRLIRHLLGRSGIQQHFYSEKLALVCSSEELLRRGASLCSSELHEFGH